MIACSIACPVSGATKGVKKAVKYKAVKVVKVAKPKAKKAKAEKMQAVNCSVCDGKSHDCPYWTGNRHMTEQEIKAFEWLEWHYLAEDGQWYELRTGNTEPVEKPDYVTRW